MSIQIDWLSYFLGVLTLLIINVILSPIVLRKTKHTIDKTTEEITALEKKTVEIKQMLSTVEIQSKEDVEKLKNAIAILKVRRKCPYCNHTFPLFTIEDVSDEEAPKD